MKSYRILLLFFLSCFFISGNAQSLSGIIKIEGGKVEGTVENGINVFKGIPFAAPPVGELRWKAPQPVKPWEGVKRADKFAPGSIQNQKLEQSEDCLYLNIWTTAKSEKEKLPVMVWIHGGGFSAGAPLEPTYFGQELTHKGVIFVSIAYRLGTLGFLLTPI